MATYTTTVESIINSCIVDSQNQTTNRTALLNYVERVSSRILRESQWLFLRSQHQNFITQPGASSYWISSGNPAPGCVNTGLNLSDIGSIIPDAVYDRTNSRKLTQDSETVLRGPGLRYPDGTFRPDRPRTYFYDYNVPGILNLYPPPDGQSTYQPVPLAPICSYVSGGSLLSIRNYYIWVTLVDSLGGESIPSSECSNIEVPFNSLLTVQYDGSDIIAANSATYGYYNIYIGNTSSGPGYLQNINPLPIGTSWTEPTLGIVFGSFSPVSSILISNTENDPFTLSVSTSGGIQTTASSSTVSVYPTFLKDTNGVTWLLQIQPTGQLTSSEISNLPVNYNPILQDSQGGFWSLGINTIGQLTTTKITGGLPISPAYPATSSVTPLNGYIVSFQYQKKKIPITSSAQTLQIPDDYTDVVIAGVNYFISLYTAKEDDLTVKIGVWKREFMEGLAQIRRDLRINFRNTDVLMPDSSTQYQTGTQTGYPYYGNF